MHDRCQSLYGNDGYLRFVIKKYMRKIISFAGLSFAVIFLFTGCGNPAPDNESSANEEQTALNTETEVADGALQREVSPVAPRPFDAEKIVYNSNGDTIQGWHWLRNASLSHFAEWTINDIPTGAPTLELDFYVLATNRSSGGRGYDAKFLLYYGSPGSDELRVKTVILPNVSAKNDPVGYDCRGQVLIPLADLDGATSLYLKAVRADKADNHVAFKRESINNLLGTSLAGESGSLGGESGATEVRGEPDSDSDGLTDAQETLYGLNKNNRDTDGDDVNDSEDLSPLLNPGEPVINDWHPKGMVRIKQQIKAIGLDGWVEKYTKVYRLIPPSSRYVHDYTDENTGTKESTMDHDHYKLALNKVFSESKFAAYKIEDKNPMDFAVADTELWHDYQSESGLTYGAGITHPNEYRFFYDWLTDYALAHLKNSEPIKYPADDNYFRLIIQPLKLDAGKENTVSIQFKSAKTYQDLYYTDDKHYKAPALMYTLYSTDNYDSDQDIILDEGLALAMIEAEGRFQADIKIPADKAAQSQTYIKISPAWYVKNGNSESYEPMNLEWDVTGLARSIKYLETNQGNSKIITQEFKDWSGLNSNPAGLTYLASKLSSADYHSLSQDLKTIQFDPAKTTDRYTVMESDYDVQTYVEKSGGLASGFISQTENMVTARWKVDEISDLPDTHWARSPKYNAAVGSLAAAQGVMSLVSDGTSAWTAYKNGDKIDTVYYSARSGLDVIGTAASLASVSERTIGYAGKAGKLAKLTTKKAAVGLAVAAGAVEISYNAYQLASTDDPILKLAYEEKIGASAIDTGISVAAVFSPHTLAFQLTWTAEAEIYSMIFGEDFAYRIAQSPGSAVMFLSTYFITGGIDSTMAETAYLDTRDTLIDHLELFNSVPLSYMTIFIDPDL